MKYIKWNKALKVGMVVKYGDRNEKKSTVSRVEQAYAYVDNGSWSIHKRGDGYWGNNGASGFLLVEQKGKELPVKYIVTYDTVMVDPYEKFSSDKELQEWLDEARRNREIIFESIEIFNVTQHRKVEVSFNFKIIK